MHALIDATSIPPSHGGVTRYIEGLLTGAEAVDGLQLTVVAKPQHISYLRGLAKRPDFLPAPRWTSIRPLRMLWEQFGLRTLAKKRSIDVVHSPHYTFCLALRSRSVVTLHDATFFSDPQYHTRLKRWFFKAWTRIALRNAAAIVVPSAATRDELMKHVGKSSQEIVVAYHGVDHKVFAPPTADSAQAFRERHAINGPWVAFLGTIEPRKNLASLIQAHTSLWAERPNATPLLLISGGKGWDEAGLHALKAAEKAGSARYLGYLDKEELSPFLGGAAIVAYPSSGEGFGLPVLEAMACGAVVLTTQRLALPEVGGSAVLYCEPTVESIGTQLSAALHGSLDIDDYRARAQQRAAAFTWHRCVEQHMPAYGAASGGADVDE